MLSDARAEAVSHQRWSDLLATHVKAGKVDYEGLQRDRQELKTYLEALEKVSRVEFASLDSRKRAAFWINAYNAWTIELVLRNHPLASIRDIVPLWRQALGNSSFKIQFIPLGHLDPRGAKTGLLSLDDIEHGILRPLFADPRIHFALVCASTSCPELRAEAYEGHTLDTQLDDAGRTFLGDPTKNRYDPSRQTLELSSIFKWFAEDFENAGGTLRFVKGYLPDATRQQLSTAPGALALSFLPYDWSLNSQ